MFDIQSVILLRVTNCEIVGNFNTLKLNVLTSNAPQDHMHARILRLENKVVMGFSKYGTMCHVLKTEVQKGVHIRNSEQRHQDDLQKMQVKLKSADADAAARQQKAEFVALAASDAQRAHDILLREADKFEQQKLEDMRRVLMNFCEIELAFHSKAVKLFTQAYRSAKKLDMVDDIVTFRTQMNIVRGSSSVGPDPQLILENCRVGCVAPETSSESELSEDSLSGADGPRKVEAGVQKQRKTAKRESTFRRSIFGGERNSVLRQQNSLTESPSMMRRERRESRKSFQNNSGMAHHYRYTAMGRGSISDHFAEYEKTIERRKSLKN